MRLNSGLFGRFSAVVVFTAVALSVAYPAASATADKQLSRKSGQVAYKPDDKAAAKNIFGSQIVADDAYAVTGPKSLAQLRMPDSSEIDIGSDTTVKVGAFHQAGPGEKNENVINVNNGIVHFVIHHPEGTAANYKFQTPTSQIAVRGTEGSIFVSTSSTGVTTTTVTIASGSVVVTTGTTQAVVNAGQAVSAAAPAGTSASTSATMSNTVTAAPGAGTSAAAGTASSTATTAATTAAVAAGGTVAVAGAAVASNTTATATATPAPTASPTPTPNPTPAPSPTPTPVPTATPIGATPAPTPTATPTPIPPVAAAPGPITILGGGGGGGGNSALSNDIFPTLPAVETATASQTNCTTPMVFSASPAGSTTFTPSTLPCVNGQISGSFTVTVNQYGSATYTVTASGLTLQHIENAFGEPTLTESGVSITPLTGSPFISLNGAGSLAASLTEQGPNPPLSVSLDCSAATDPNFKSTNPATAGIGLNTLGNFALSGAFVASFTIVIRSAPVVTGATTNQPPACNLDISGAAGSFFIIPLNITTTNIGITGVKRTIQTGPRVPKSK